MLNIFTYGSLMFERVWSHVVEGNYLKSAAVLSGYDRKAIKDELYPAIFPAPGYSRVNGIVYFDISAEDSARLDIFEGDYYFRKTEKVLIRNIDLIPAEVYVLKEEYYPLISHRNWDVEKFAGKDIDLFIESYIGRYKKVRQNN